MAGARKLQAEIDRCLKKVTEGVEKFEETWTKVHNASNQNQKEKYEEDLKKEIKKLQRLRDQIKSWLTSGEIKDKTILLENRKLIETQMERFKVVERETKTKAYSKEGLTASMRLDPAERERAEVIQWLNSCIETLNIQVDQFEAEIESLNCGGKRKKGRNEDNARLEECQMWVEKHRDHIQKLETLLRMLDNTQVESGVIRDIKEDINDYIENSQEPDFVENEYIYDDIEGLEEMLLDVSNLDIGAPEHTSVDASETASSTNSVSGNSPILGQPVYSNHNHSSDTVSGLGMAPEELKRRHRSSQSDDSKSSKKGGSTVLPPSSPLPTQGNKVSSTPIKSSSQNMFSLSQSPNNTSPSSGLQGVTQSHALNPSLASYPNYLRRSQPNLTNPSGQIIPNFAAVTAQHNGHPACSAPLDTQEAEISTPPPDRPAPHSPTGSGRSVELGGAPGLPAPGSYPHPSQGVRDVPSSQFNGGTLHNLQTSKELPESLSSLKSLAQQALSSGSLIADSNSSQSGHLGLIGGFGVLDEIGRSGLKTEAHIPPLLGVAPLGPVPLNKDHQFQYNMLEAACHHLPHPSDSERLRPYLPRTPVNTPSHYPQAPPPGIDTIDFFTRLSTETLFFIFYYMEGTKAQYLAAKALKKQSWRFHTKYMMWFQRHEEPKIINDEYEQGTYIYFDYEKWGQRKKEGFTFEYRFLEDRDLN
ncbi:CCR4-NOT transcription complex subunit 3 isoform X2 [Eurytemora carolleeae]|uniref:CCR4-NOT transcription complex subunit 3 isoform X2 n=1 Tax=Eurytemora carolleeae TaxID=1294199 RepID=UPI000C75F625|nr:CCR4-NOT transcription complex subunit 3 isoform X2 [Eurytemora carolleeae]|eukprot:XP_023327096.1 CCR4-NOT transcription complex subunit 3-like isoform X2 [Eurytemora affinis]